MQYTYIQLKTFFFVFLLFLSGLCNLNAQSHKIDSFRKVLMHSKEDTDKIKALSKWGVEVENSNPDTALLLGNQALNMANKIGWIAGRINALANIGVIYEIKGKLAIAFTYEDSALAMSEKYGYRDIFNYIYDELGNIASDQNNYSAGLAYYFKAMAFDSATGGKMLGAICNNIGLDYEDMGDYLRAEEYYLKTEKIFTENNDSRQIATVIANLGNFYYLKRDYAKGLESNFKALAIDSSLANLGGIIAEYQNIGLGYLYLKNYSNSLNYAFKAIALSKKTGEIGGMPKVLINIALTYTRIYELDTLGKDFTYRLDNNILHVAHQALLDSAVMYEEESIRYANILKDRLSQITAIKGIGDICILKKQYTKAIACFLQAYNIADSLGVLQQALEFSEALGHAYSKIGNYAAAIKYLDEALALKDSVYGIEKGNKMAEMEARYQDEKMQKEIEGLAEKNEIQNLLIKQSTYLTYGLASLAILISLIGFLLIRQNRINTKNTKIELGQKLLRSQMNPHFIFNAITSIQNYIYKEEPQEAANYLSSVFKLMRTIIESSKEEYILLEKEISSLKHYLVLQQLCAKEKFDFNLDISSNIDIGNLLIPPMIAQPFIENAIEHGIANKTDGRGVVTIRMAVKNDMLLLEIEDNGIGRDKAKEISKQNSGAHLSVATNITRERIALLNRKAKKKITMQIVDLKDEYNNAMGTRVVFELPLNTIA